VLYVYYIHIYPYVLNLILTKTQFNEGVDKNLKLITCHLPEAYLSGIEELVNMNVYPNRSEVIRVAIRDLLKEELSSLIRMKPEKD
jgi:hypothetical protein